MMPTYSNAHAKVKKWIFNAHFPRNWFEFDIILNDFSSSTIGDTQIQFLFTVFQNPKNPGIHPKYE